MALYEQVDALGEAILEWADPENQFRGYTEVRFSSSNSFPAADEAVSVALDVRKWHCRYMPSLLTRTWSCFTTGVALH